MALRNTTGLEIEPEFKLKDEVLETGNLDLVEALVAPHSRLTGRTLSELDFHWRYKTIVLAVQRRGRVLREKLANVRLRFGGALLLLGPKEDVARLRGDENLIDSSSAAANLNNFHPGTPAHARSRSRACAGFSSALPNRSSRVARNCRATLTTSGRTFFKSRMASKLPPRTISRQRQALLHFTDFMKVDIPLN